MVDLGARPLAMVQAQHGSRSHRDSGSLAGTSRLKQPLHTRWGRGESWGKATRVREHAAQTTAPHTRQWWRWCVNPNLVPHPACMHTGASSFGVQVPDVDARTVPTRMCWKKRPRMPEAWSREVC